MRFPRSFLAAGSATVLFLACGGSRSTPRVARDLAGPPCSNGLSRGSAVGLNERAISRLRVASKESGSHALVVLEGGKLVIEDYADGRAGPLPAQSVAKSVAALAVGALLRADLKFNLDAPVATLFPEWNKDSRKAKITFRHLMSHTSGLATERADREKGERREVVIVRAPMMHEPGGDYRYNNAAADFLSLVIFKRTGLRLDDFLQREVFGPVGVRGAHWQKDGAGHPLAAGDLFIDPVELAKLGQLILQDGVWEGRRILAPGWISEMTVASQTFNQAYGLFFWRHGRREYTVTPELFSKWESVGVPTSTLDRLRPFLNRPYTDREAFLVARATAVPRDELRIFRKQLEELRVEPFRIGLAGAPTAFYARGYMGQYLVVVPARGLVAVRMREPSEEDEANENELVPHEYRRFVDDVLALARDST